MNYFSDEELRCKETGENKFQQQVLNILNRVRHEYGYPMIVTSGYRSPRHSIEAKKANPYSGDHPKGRGVDIKINNQAEAIKLIAIAAKHGMNAFGIHDKFVHLAYRSENNHIVTWKY